MNLAYRIVWNVSRQAWMVASEFTSAKGKTKTQKTNIQTKTVGHAVVLSAALLTTTPLAVQAAGINNWVGADGEWSTATNWDSGVIPTDLANIDNGSTVSISDGSSQNLTANLYLGNSDGSTGNLTITNGSLTTSWTNIAVGSGATGTLIIDSSSAALTANYLRVGFTGEGTLIVKNGGTLESSSLLLGYDEEAIGNMQVTGTGSSVQADGATAIIGYRGEGTLNLADGANFNINNGTGTLILGDQAAGSGVLNIGAASGDTVVTAGTLGASSVELGAGNGIINFNHNNTNYVFSQEIVDANGKGFINFLSGSTTLTGDLEGFSGNVNVVGGTLSIAANKPLTLGQAGATADYTQTLNGLLRLGLIDASQYGKLNVTGTATFADGSKLDVDVKGAPSLANGSLLSKVISAGTLDAGSFEVTDNSLLYSFAAEKEGNTVGLRVTRDGNTSVLQSVNSEGFKSGRSAARVLDGFVNGGSTNTDIANVSTAFGRLSNDQEITEAVAETLPLLVGGTTKLAANTLHSTNRVIQSRQANTRGLSSGDAFLTDKNMWLKPVGSWTRQQERNGVSGYDADSYGFVVGMDGDVSQSSRLGLALSYMNTRVDGNGMSSGNKADIDAYQLIAYGSHDLSQFENVELNWQADVGMNKNDSKRQISFIGRTAEAVYDSYTAHVGVGIGKRFELNDSSTVMPSLRADYAYIRDESYTEKGAGAINLDVDSVHSDEFILMVQTDIDHQLNDKTTLLANIGVGYDVINDDTSLTASYTGGGTAFTTDGIDPSPWLARAGVGATVNLNDYTDITAQYDVEGREDFLNQTASVKLRWSF
ncbi:MAG TPA: autotransporter domain-containing protein [Methylophaga aminisulfidivorans]|uniref:autotransporter domain-containing protein n=1 Tax=Methylophaga TaxID=40222 RepID=UPI001776A8A8|nr:MULTISPECIES: autotransporter domain-containing protein [Methylophaga]HIC47591.1 autotransporter domain-containing protein [Methylophaga sp.]HIM39403.1 autotransporter domain-containing protein [Methylophaga aminisulfidivorans]